MTVKELIEKLQIMPPESTIVYYETSWAIEGDLGLYDLEYKENKVYMSFG